jgi:hypothetical protein
MRPMLDETEGGIFVDGTLAARLYRSDGRPGSSSDGFAMWSHDCRPLGWVADGRLLVVAVVATKLFNGELTARWQATSTGVRLIHRRYTLSIEQNSAGWVPNVVDEMSGRSHTFKPMKTAFHAMYLLDDLLRRIVGRQGPGPDSDNEPLGKHPPASMDHQLQLALKAMGPDIGELVRDDYIDPDRWIGHRRMSALFDLADLLDDYFDWWLDPLPLLACALADYIKLSLLRLYGGADALPIDARFPLTFTKVELEAFRDRFRRRPITDEDYLLFVHKHFVIPVRKLRRRDRPRRYPKSPTVSRGSYWPTLRPRCDRGDHPMILPLPPVERLFEAAASS